MPQKRAGNRAPGRPFTGADDPRRNKVPPPPGPGRPPDAFRAKMRELASRDDVLANLEAILKDKDHPHYLRAWQEAADRGFGKATQPVDVTSDGKPLTIAVYVPEPETEA